MVENRILSFFLVLALSASSGVAGGVLHLCEGDSPFWLGCCCPNDDEPDPCTAIENDCCELRSLPAASSSSPTVAQSELFDLNVVPVRLLDADQIFGASSAQVSRFSEWRAPPRAGPPLFLQLCSYLA
jgi:hypothetical protein